MIIIEERSSDDVIDGYGFHLFVLPGRPLYFEPQ